MCGIVGLANGHPVAEDLVGALGRLEYRGYDSAGIALAGPGLPVLRTLGRAKGLSAQLRNMALRGTAGIGHTRWATHGKAELRNAHPHARGDVAVVHNGVIENHATLRAALIARGHVFHSDTDSEVIPHLMSEALEAGATPLEALRETCRQLEGAYAIAAVTRGAPHLLFAARQGSPLILARAENTAAIASDPLALAGLAEEYTALEEGDVLELGPAGVRFDAASPRAQRQWHPVAGRRDVAGMGQHVHHTRAEIAEQPMALADTDAALRAQAAPTALCGLDRLTLIACGSSLYAGAVARDAFERASGTTLDIEIASEFRDRAAPPWGGAILVSQSGETADTLSAMSRFTGRGLPTVAVVNVVESAIGRAASQAWPVNAGPEIGVAATKSFTAQLLALLRLGIALGEARQTGDATFRAALATELDSAGEVCAAAESFEPVAADIARRLVAEGEAMFIGRGWGAAMAAEAALKLKELSYLRADAYPAGELKHGPIALIREGSPVLVSAPGGTMQASTLANASAVAARGAHVIAITNAEGAEAARAVAAQVVVLPGPCLAAPFAQAVFFQLLAYHAAVALEREVDRPRNLAKSVTVE